jgi:hypothetical protein
LLEEYDILKEIVTPEESWILQNNAENKRNGKIPEFPRQQETVKDNQSSKPC